MINIPIPRFFKYKTSSDISAIAIGSIPVKGSSSNMKLGLDASALAISTLRLSPPERASAGLFLM